MLYRWIPIAIFSYLFSMFFVPRYTPFADRARSHAMFTMCDGNLHGIKLLVFNKRMAMKLEASFSLTNINDSVKVIQLPLSKSIICGSQAPRSVWIIVIKYLQRGKISQFSCWKNVRACSSYDLTRGSYSLSPVLPGDVPIQVDGGHDRIQCVTAKPTN